MIIESKTMASLKGIDPHSDNSTKGDLKKWLPVGGIVLALVVAWSMGWFDYISLSNLIQNREALTTYINDHLFFGLLAYILIYAGLVAISFPGASLLTIASGFLFGGIIGGFASVVAATIGAVIIFQIAKTSFGETLGAKTGKFIDKMRAGFLQDSFLYLLTLRLTPIFPFWVMNIVPALLNMNLAPFTIATFLGIIPGTFAYAYIGAGLDSVILAQEAADPGCSALGTCHIDLSSLVTKEVVIASVALAIISILPVVVKKLRHKA